MQIYNTLTRQKEELIPLEPGHFKIYSCGPTVYRYIHIGNLRTFSMADWLKRALQYEGFQVTHIKNITDVGHMRVERVDQGEDKIIAQARKEGKSSADIAAFYTRAFREDEQSLNILPADNFPKATEHIPEMIQIVEGLIEKGIAYEVDGNVFFDIRAYPSYGKLSGNLLEELLAGARDFTDSLRRNPEDFPLWKKAEPGREMAWDSPWGRGFPGWHIECSAMSMKYLGKRFDIHTGGVDNIFPHHECELAQSEAYSDEVFVNYWVHAQHLLADGLKMAKSTGNAYTLAEVMARGFEPMALRYFYTTAHYRSRINFTFTALRSAQTALERLREAAVSLYLHAPSAFSSKDLEVWNAKFMAAIRDDLNMPRAMAVIWQLLHSKTEVSPATKLKLLLDWDNILGFGLKAYLAGEEWQKRLDSNRNLATLPKTIADMVKERHALRLAGKYQAADSLREKIKLAGYNLRDTAEGTLAFARRADEDMRFISSSNAAPDNTKSPDLYEFSVNLLAHNNRSDLERTINSLIQHSYGRNLELVIIDNGSTDDTVEYLQELIKDSQVNTHECDLALQVIFADHNLGFAAGRNATFRASRGKFIIMLDTSIEFKGDVWTELEEKLSVTGNGVAGPYGLITQDLRDFQESDLAEVDAIEGYLLAFRREIWVEVGPIDEKFRFYRLMDIYLSFFIKAAGYKAVTTPQVAGRIIKHPHREWYSLSEEEQRTKSKKNWDMFRERWHHGQSLLVLNYQPQNLWFGHDHPKHLMGRHTHKPEDLPPPGIAHNHSHRHWSDHEHNHPHYHSS
jgi:cysteinyl-tRNA synthetase